jgi:hypothetical protein
MKRPLRASIYAVLLAFAGLSAASSAPARETRLAPVKGADYTISMALHRHPQHGEVVTVTYSIAKGDGAVAYEGQVRGETPGGGTEAVRLTLRRATDEVAAILLAGKIPPRVASSN